MQKVIILLISIYLNQILFAECDSGYTYYSNLPSNVTILSGDSCLYDDDISVLDSLILINSLDYNLPLELGTQTWLNGRLRFLVAGNYGNSSGVNDTIYSLPGNIGNWSSLASLYLEWHRISELPDSFINLKSLQSFYINNNILTSLIDSMGNLSNLYFLDLGYNNISSISESICELENLSYLWLFNNNLTILPNCLCNMGIDWNNNDMGGYPYFAIGANELCDSIPICIDSIHWQLSLDQFYYSFPVYSPQNCDTTTNLLQQSFLPYQYRVSAPYPNPFNPKVKMDLLIPFDRRMDIRVYNILGREIDIISDREIFNQGLHSLVWIGSTHPSGIYFIKFEDGVDTVIRKIILAR